MNKTQRIEIGSIEEIIERLQVAQKFGYKNLYLDLDTKEYADEETDYDEENKEYGILRTEYHDTHIRDEIVRLSLDCDNMFTVKTMYN